MGDKDYNMGYEDEYAEHDDNKYRKKMITKFMYEGIRCRIGFQFWLEKEMKGYAKRMAKYRDEKGKYVVDVASDGDDESYMTRQQQSLSRRSPSTSYEAPVSVRNGSYHPIKRRTARSNDYNVQKQVTKKMQHMTINTENEHDTQAERKQKKTKREGRSLPQPLRLPPPPPGVMPINLQQAIIELHGTTPVWLTEKRFITVSDTNPTLSRLLIPTCGDVLKEYLTAEEKYRLLNPTDESRGLRVMVVDTSGAMFEVDLRIWGSLKKFVFAGNWNKMVKTLNMKAKSDAVQLWCFRIPAENGSNLCFAINIERGEP